MVNIKAKNLYIVHFSGVVDGILCILLLHNYIPVVS